jgi:hypothetical protein
MSTYDRVPVATLVKAKLRRASQVLGAVDPGPMVGRLIDESFAKPLESCDYGVNTLTPGAVPVEPSFSERESGALRFTMEPLVGASPSARVHEATREMRRLVNGAFGRDALRWFDRWSEEWRGALANPRAHYGAWFGMAVDDGGLSASKIYYELTPEQLEALPPRLRGYVLTALESVPGLVPLFTSIRCGRESGVLRVTLLHRGPLRMTDLTPLMERLGMARQLPGLMQIVGLAMGGRFELPDQAVLLGLQEAEDGPELKFEMALGMIPDLPASFLDLLGLALAERPRELRALQTWLQAFTPETADWPGQFSVLSMRVTPTQPARVSLYLRPIDFELRPTANGATAAYVADLRT